MPDALLNAPPPAPPPADAACTASAVAAWLGGLLDAARDRGDAALCRLIADVVDDLGGAAKG